MRNSTFFIYFIGWIIGVLSSNPFIEEFTSCSPHICPEATKFRWPVGLAGEYDYRASVNSTMRGVTNNNTTLILTARVTLHVLAPCEHAITMDDVRLESSAVVENEEVQKELNDEEFVALIQKHPLRYSYNDGSIGLVCPTSGDPTWSVNIKKAVVSALQNTMVRLDLDHEDVERDITGDCPTTYQLDNVTSSGLVIVKRRDLNLCSNRFSRTSHIQSVGYQMKTSMPNIPLISSESECRQTVRTGQLVHVTCGEQHLLQPYSSGEAGVVTVTSQELQLVEHSTASVDQEKISVRSSLLYNHLPAKSAFGSKEDSLAKSEEILTSLCRNESEVGLKTASHFLQLIGHLRGMNHAQINSLYRLSPQICRHAQKFIGDALPVVSTTAAMIMMRDLMRSEEVSVQVANSWLLAIFFTPSVDLEMVEVASDFLSQKRPEVSVRSHLAVGAMIRQYCQQHKGCQDREQVLAIVDRLAEELGTDCSNESEQQEKLILVTLKSLANAGFATSKLLRKLNRCLLKRENPSRIKVAAIESFRRMSCDVNRGEIRAVFTDISEDSEVRIAAYRALMRCLSFKELELIFESLKSEPVNQVLSYVWTHLTNLQETSSAYHLEVQGLMADLHLQKKFSADARKFSKNMELSGFNPELHIGAVLDSDLVYSSLSYIPRSFAMNSTIEMFGESINLLEVGMRTEGLERFVESIFAPGGLFNGRTSALGQKKSKSQPEGELAEIADKFDAAGRFGSPMASFHMKIFGNEIDFVDLRMSDMRAIVQRLNENGPRQWISALAKKQTVDYSRTMNFLEGAYIVPTGLGLPLNLTATAVAAFNLQMETQVQLDKLFTEKKLDLALHIKPSGAITFDGAMLVDAVCVHQGLNIQTTLHTSTLIDTSLSVHGHSQVKAKVNMPKERMEIFNFETKVRFIHQNGDQHTESPIEMKREGAKKEEYNRCTGGGYYKGWETCAHLAYINSSAVGDAPYFPLTGPARMGLYVEKTDKSMTGYEFNFKFGSTRSDQKMLLEFDSPNSIVDRKMVLKLRRRISSGEIGFRLDIPGHRLRGKGMTWWDSSKKGVQLTLLKSSLTVLGVTALLERSADHHSVAYKPTFVVEFLSKSLISLTGSVKQAEVNSVLKRVIGMKLESPWIRLSLDSDATQSKPLYQSKIAIKHNLDELKERTLLLALESQLESDNYGGSLGHWMAVVDLDFTEKAHLIRAIRWNWKSSPVGNQLLFQTAMRPEDFGENVVFSIGYSTDFAYTDKSRSMNASAELRYPVMGVDLKLMVSHDSFHQGLKNFILIRYSPGREVRSLLDATGLPLFVTGRLTATWQLYLPSYQDPLSLALQLQLLPRNNRSITYASKFNVSATWQKSELATVLGQYTMVESYRSASMQHNVSLHVTSAGSSLATVQTLVELEQSGVKLLVQAKRNANDYNLELDYFVVSSNSYVERSLQTSLSYPGSVYSGRGTLGLGDRFQLSLGLHLDMLRDVQLELQGRSSNDSVVGEADVSWDAVRDPTRRLAFWFSSQRHLDTPEIDRHNVSAAVIYLANKVVLASLTEKTDGETLKSFRNNITISYGEDETLSLLSHVTTNKEDVEPSIKAVVFLHTPLHGWETSQATMSYRQGTGSLAGSASVQAGGEYLNVTLNSLSEFTGKLSVTADLVSSLDPIPDLELLLDHRGSEKESISSGSLVANDEKIFVELHLQNLSQVDLSRFVAKLNTSSTIQGYRSGGLYMEAMRNEEKVKSVISSRLEENGHDIVFEAVGGSEPFSALLTADQIQPPANKLTASLRLDPSTNGRNVQMEVFWPESRLALDGKFYIISANDFGVGMQISSSFNTIGDVGVIVKHSLKDGKIDSEASAAWLQKHPLAAKLVADVSSWYKFDALATLQLPLHRWYLTSVHVINDLDLDSRSISTSLSTILDDDKAYLTVNGSASDEEATTHVSAVVPMGHLRLLDVKGRLIKSSNGKHFIELLPSWQYEDAMSEQIEVIGELETGTDLTGHVKLTSPWSQPLTASVNHHQADTATISTLAASLGDHQINLKSDLTMSEENGYILFLNGNSTLEFLPETQVRASIMHVPNFNATFSMTAPEQIDLSTEADIWSENKFARFQSQTPLVWLPKTAEIRMDSEEDGSYQLSSDVALPNYPDHLILTGKMGMDEVDLDLKTPFQQIRTAQLHFQSGISDDGVQPQFSAVWNDHVVEAEATASLLEEETWPQSLDGSFKYLISDEPRVKGAISVVRDSNEDRMYKLEAELSSDQLDGSLSSKLFFGPLKYGIFYEVNGIQLTGEETGKIYFNLPASDVGKTSFKLDLKSHQTILQTLLLHIYYSQDEDGGKSTALKLDHPTIALECKGRLLLDSIEQVETSGLFSLRSQQMNLTRAFRLSHLTSTDSGKLGLGWNLGEYLGKYHTLIEYDNKLPENFDGLLLAGRDVFEDRSLPTDLNVGVDLDRRGSMGKGALTVELLETRYTVDADYSASLPYRASFRAVRRGGGRETSAEGSVSADKSLGQSGSSPETIWRTTANLTLPLKGYNRIDSWSIVRTQRRAFIFQGSTSIRPSSSFYSRTAHHLNASIDVSQLPEAIANLSYVSEGRSIFDRRQAAIALHTIYRKEKVGIVLSGDFPVGKYRIDATKIESDSENGAFINISTDQRAFREFIARYSIIGENDTALQSVFSCAHNNQTFIEGKYLQRQLMDNSRFHDILVNNSLYPFSANFSHFSEDDLIKLSFGCSSLNNINLTALISTKLTSTNTTSHFSTSLSLPQHKLRFQHSIARPHDASRMDWIRFRLSPQAYFGVQVHVNSTHSQKSKGGRCLLQLDLPTRSLALLSTADLSRSKSPHSLPGLRTGAKFQWDLIAKPERSVEAILEFEDISTPDKTHYNTSVTANLMEKPVVLQCELHRTQQKPLQLQAALRYSSMPESHVQFAYTVVNQNRGSKLDYTTTLYMAHPVTNFSVTGKGHLHVSTSAVSVSGKYTYTTRHEVSEQSEVNIDLNKKTGVFNAKMFLPSTLYEVKLVKVGPESRLLASEIPLDYRTPRSLTVRYNPDKPAATMEALYDTELGKRLHVDAGVLNPRHWRIHVFRRANRYQVDDLVLFVRLNHSHLFTSQARWRKRAVTELKDWIASSVGSHWRGFSQTVQKEWNAKSHLFVKDFESKLRQPLKYLRKEFDYEENDSVLSDYLTIKERTKAAYKDDVFFTKTILSYFYGEDDSVINAIFNRLSQWIDRLSDDMGFLSANTHDMLEKLIKYLQSLVTSTEASASRFSDTMIQFADHCNKWVRSTYLYASDQVQQVLSAVADQVSSWLILQLEQYRPQLLMLHHTVEAGIVRLTSGVINWINGEMNQSELFTWIRSLQGWIDQIYRDIQERDPITNIFDYTYKFLQWSYVYSGAADMLEEPLVWIQQKWANPTPLVANLKSTLSFMYDKVSSLWIQLGIKDALHSLLLRIYQGESVWSHTAIQNAQRSMHGKAIMEMKPEDGYISYTQLLPMPWYSLNQQPVWKDLPEVQTLRSYQVWAEESDWSIYDLVYYYWPGVNPYDWLPPFTGHAALSGSTQIVTFDGQLYSISSDCKYLLVADLLDNRFQVDVQFRSSEDLPKVITVHSGGHSVTIGRLDKFSIYIDDKESEAPASVGDLSVVRMGDVITVEVGRLLLVSCNQRADLCSIEITGWTFGRTGGLLGVYDNEPSSDAHTPDHLNAFPELFAASWALGSCDNGAVKIDRLAANNGLLGDSIPSHFNSQSVDGFCWGLLGDPRSEYRICHRLVDPSPYLMACIKSQVNGRCVAIQAYVMACQHKGMPLKVPNKCVRCNIRDEHVIEGKTVVVNNNEDSTEVVFIVEAKECNANITEPRAIRRLMSAIESALIDAGFVYTRYAVVAFGGSGSFSEPRALTVNGRVFNKAGNAVKAFSNIRTGRGNEDVFGALRFAAMLPFSAGVSRTFLLMICSRCLPQAMSFEHTTLANAFTENLVTLHVLIHNELEWSDDLVENNNNGGNSTELGLLGVDKDRVWTTRDADDFRGNTTLLSRVKPLQPLINLCEPLARMETKGSVFSLARFRPDPVTNRLRLRSLWGLLKVLGRRVALTAKPRPCEECECVTASDGTAYPLCYPCSGLLALDPDDDVVTEVGF
uniref:MTTP-like protein 2 n=1 Tax=Parasacculina yatsui TaxID=2836420 RepID=A0A8K1RF39_9CRUS|nr:MTTP-like protein 2 [Parasacculina yatsui]